MADAFGYSACGGNRDSRDRARKWDVTGRELKGVIPKLMSGTWFAVEPWGGDDFRLYVKPENDASVSRLLGR